MHENVYRVQPHTEWRNVNADLALTDPPFGIDFDGTNETYNRDDDRVVDGYVEWGEGEYTAKIESLLQTLADNTTDDGQALIFSGWNNSNKIHTAIQANETWRVEGKLYWAYNFAPYCTRRPAHNVYEIYWVVKSDDWYYTNECRFDHCQDGEANLSMISVKRNYLTVQPKYPTRLPPKIVAVLLDHFSDEGDRVFDPLAGSGTVGHVAAAMERTYTLGDGNANAKDVFEQTDVDTDTFL